MRAILFVPVPPITTADCTLIPRRVAWTQHINQSIASCLGTTPVYCRKLRIHTNSHKQHQHHATSPSPPSHRSHQLPTWCLHPSTIRPRKPMHHTLTTFSKPHTVRTTETPLRLSPALPSRRAPAIAPNLRAILTTPLPPTMTTIVRPNLPPTKGRRSALSTSQDLVAWISLLPAPPPPNPRRAPPLLGLAGVRTLTSVISHLVISNAKMSPCSSKRNPASVALSPDATTSRVTDGFRTSSATSKLTLAGGIRRSGYAVVLGWIGRICMERVSDWV